MAQKKRESIKMITESVKKSAWDRVLASRMNDRPIASDYIDLLFDDFVEFHGDRYFKDDQAIIGGIASFHGMPVTVIAQEKGHNTKENLEHNFGMPSPDGYRKALRLMKQAEKFNRPVICFVDTPGAHSVAWKQRSAVRERQLQEIFLKCHHLEHRFFQ